MKKAPLIILSGIVMIMLMLSQCKSKKEKTILGIDEKVVTQIIPVQLPTNIVPGFHFPEDSNLINKWTNDKKFVNSYDSANIYKHAWGIWAGLTAQSGQTFAGNSLLVYETWLGLNEVRELVINDQSGDEKSFIRIGRAPLSRPKQFEHAARFAANKAGLTFNAASILPSSENNVNTWVTVSYSPDAANYVTKNKIFKQSVINKYYKAEGLGAIPKFPTKSITVKPTYLVYSNTTNVLLKLPVWITAPATPDSNFTRQANSFVFVDKNNKQTSGKVPIPVESSEQNVAKIAAATVNLSDFIYLTIDQQMANEMNKQDSIQGLNDSSRAQKGQIALLVAMHVTTKEISNWTWQSYYWTPNRSQPGSPSSNLAASLRPSEIKGAAANYACVAAYVMLTTPNNSSNNMVNRSMFGYNPYLEGGFGPSTFFILTPTIHRISMGSNRIV